MLTYLILPGYGNSDQNHWQSYFETMLPNCRRILQKSWDKPLCDDWVDAINDAVTQYQPSDVVLISHSLGGIAIAHWAARFTTAIKGAFIVAPPDVENPWMDVGLESFTPIPQGKLPFPSIMIGSTNDHWATVARTTTFAANWGCELKFIGDAGHINSDSGHGKWDKGLEILKDFEKGLG